MNPNTKRAIFRWLHILFALPIVAYIYGPPAEAVQYLPYFRFIYLPVVVLTGLWMWKGAAISGLFSKAR